MTWLCGAASLVVLIVLLFTPKPWSVEGGVASLDKPVEFLGYYGWWTAVFNLILLVGLALTARWWTAGTRPECGWWPTPSLPRWFVPGLAAIMLVQGFFSVQRLGQSLWDDEANSVYRVICGRLAPSKEGSLEVRGGEWEQTLWNYKRPTNHHLQSLLSKISHETWRAITRPKELPFSETVLRLPSFVAGLLSVAALGLVLWRMGFARAGMAAALILALHPWFLRYASEMRGYVFAMLFTLLALLFLIMALEKGTWAWWVALSLSWLAMMYAYPGTLFFVVVLSLSAFVAILVRNPKETRLFQLGRWFVSSLFAGMAFLQLMIPCVPQVMGFMSEVMRGDLTPRWHQNVLAHFLTGIPWNNSDSQSSGYPELQWSAEASEPVFTIVLIGTGLAVAVGLLRVLLRKPAGWIAALLWTLPALGIYLMARVQGHYLYEWYLIIALPGAIASFALGADLILGPTKKLWRFAPATGLATLVLAFFVFTEPARHRLTTSPLQHMREAVAIARPIENPMDPAQDHVLTAQVGVRLENYDPRIQRIISREDLQSVMAESRNSNSPLFVIMGNAWAVGAQSPEIMEILRSRERFQNLKSLQGLDPTLTLTIFEYLSESEQTGQAGEGN